jgi:hypothetical protein
MLAREADAGPLDLSRRTWKVAQEQTRKGDTARLPRSA